MMNFIITILFTPACLWIPEPADVVGRDIDREADSDVDADSDADADGDVDADTGDDTGSTDADGDGYPADGGDCDDTNASVNPGAPPDELCDGVDDNCDGVGPSGCGRSGTYVIEDIGRTSIEGDHDSAGQATALVDLDGDGVAEVAIGAPTLDGEENSSGGVHVFRGPLLAGALSVADADGALGGELAGDSAGWPLTASSDLSGDGVDDLLVGAYQSDDGAQDAGKIYLVSGIPGRDDHLGDSVGSIVGAVANEWVGYRVAAPGDLDGDGVGDVLVGAAVYSANDARIGIFLGPLADNRWSDSPDHAIRCDSCVWNANSGVAAIGDADGDGLADWYAAPDGGGVVYVWRGVPASESFDDADATVALVGDGARYGSSVYPSSRAGGDVNGDGFDDFSFGTGGLYGDSYQVPAESWLLHGPLASGAHTVNEAAATFSAADDEASPGQPVINGDLDGDGHHDVATVGALGDPWSEYVLAVWYGPVSGTYSTEDAPLQISGGGVGTPFGPDFAADATEDGLDDLLVSASNGTSSPSVWLIPGVGF